MTFVEGGGFPVSSRLILGVQPVDHLSGNTRFRTSAARHERALTVYHSRHAAFDGPPLNPFVMERRFARSVVFLYYVQTDAIYFSTHPGRVYRALFPRMQRLAVSSKSECRHVKSIVVEDVPLDS